VGGKIDAWHWPMLGDFTQQYAPALNLVMTEAHDLILFISVNVAAAQQSLSGDDALFCSFVQEACSI